MSTTEETRAFLEDLFDRLAREGWTSGLFLDSLADDMVWTVTGTSPILGDVPQQAGVRHERIPTAR
jgi:ketosteroid isomerase-like protein